MEKNKKSNYLFEKDYEHLLECNTKLYEYYGNEYGIFGDIQNIAGGISAGIGSAVKGFLNLMAGVSKYKIEVKKIKKIKEKIEDYKKELQEFYDLKFELISKFDEILKKIKEYTKVTDFNELEIKEDDFKLLNEYFDNLKENFLKLFQKIKIIQEYQEELSKIKENHKDYSSRLENPFLEKLQNETEAILSLILQSEIDIRKEYFKKIDGLQEIKKIKEFNDWLSILVKNDKNIKEKEKKFIFELIKCIRFIIFLKETYETNEKELKNEIEKINSAYNNINNLENIDLKNVLKDNEDAYKNIEKIKEKEKKEEDESIKLLKTLDTDASKEGVDEKTDLEKLDKITKSAWEKMSDTDKEAYIKIVKETLTKKKYVLNFYVYVYTLLEENIKKINDDKLSTLIDTINKVLITAAKNKNLKSTFIQIKQQIKDAKNNKKTKTEKVVKEYSLQDILTKVKTIIVDQTEKNKKSAILNILKKEKDTLLKELKNADDDVKRNPPYLGEEFIKKINTALQEKLKKDPLLIDIIEATDSI
jgi:hypothetical protein